MTNKTVFSKEEVQRIKKQWQDDDGAASVADLIQMAGQAALQSTEIQQLSKDAERLDFMIENLAWAQSFERDGSILQYRLMTQNEDEDYVFMSGEDRYFNTPRDAIDAAMEVKP